jgi:hypothetical protein
MDLNKMKGILEANDVDYALVGTTLRFKLRGVLRAKELVEAGNPDLIELCTVLADKDNNPSAKNILVATGHLAPDPTPEVIATSSTVEEDYDEDDTTEVVRDENGEVLLDEEGNPVYRAKNAVAPLAKLDREEVEW